MLDCSSQPAAVLAHVAEKPVVLSECSSPMVVILQQSSALFLCCRSDHDMHAALHTVINNLLALCRNGDTAGRCSCCHCDA